MVFKLDYRFMGYWSIKDNAVFLRRIRHIEQNEGNASRNNRAFWFFI